jgi:hypothetical protein
MQKALEAKFDDINGLEWLVEIFLDGAQDDFVTVAAFQAAGVRIVNEANADDIFMRVIHSKCYVDLMASTEQETTAILQVQTGLGDYYGRVSQGGNIRFVGRVYQDLGQEQNKPLPRAFTIEMRDPITEIFRTPSDKLIRDSDPNVFGALPMTLPKLWIRALENWKFSAVGGFGFPVVCAGAWRNENNAGASFNIAKNYIGSHVLLWPACAISGQKSFTELKRPGRIYSEDKDDGTGTFGERGRATFERNENQYYTIGEMVLALLEALDLVMLMDSGKTYFIQRELFNSGTWQAATVDSDYTISTSPPLYGFDEIGTIDNGFTPAKLYAQGQFGGRRRLWKVRHTFVNVANPVFSELTRASGTTPDNFWLHERSNFPNGLSSAAANLISGVNESSFDFVKISGSLTLNVDRWGTGQLLPALYIQMRIFSGSQGWVNGATNVSGPNTAWFSVAEVRPYWGTTGGAAYNRSFEFLIGPPDGATLVDIQVQFRVVVNGFATLNDVLDNRAGRETTLRGTVTASIAQDTQDEGGRVFEAVTALNEKTQEVSDRGQLLYENLLGNQAQYQIGTMEDNAASIFTANTLSFLNSWQRLNTETPTRLAELRAREMLYQTRIISQVLEGDFRSATYVPAYESLFIYGKRWRWISRELSANTGEYSFRALECRRQVFETPFTGNPIFDGPIERDTSLFDGGSTSGTASGGRLSGEVLMVLNQNLYTELGETVNFELIQLLDCRGPFPRYTVFQVFDPSGMFVGEIELDEAIIDPFESESIYVNYRGLGVLPAGSVLTLTKNEMLRILREGE